MITRMVDGFTVTLANEGSAEVVDWFSRKFDETKQELDTLKVQLTQKDAEISALKAAAAKAKAGEVTQMTVGDKQLDSAAATARRPAAVTELQDEDDPRLAYMRHLVATSGAFDGEPHASQVFAANHMSTPQQEAAHWDARAKALLDSGKVKIVTSDKDARHA
jgi:hypothetical protein